MTRIDPTVLANITGGSDEKLHAKIQAQLLEKIDAANLSDEQMGQIMDLIQQFRSQAGQQ